MYLHKTTHENKLTLTVALFSVGGGPGIAVTRIIRSVGVRDRVVHEEQARREVRRSYITRRLYSIPRECCLQRGCNVHTVELLEGTENFPVTYLAYA